MLNVLCLMFAITGFIQQAESTYQYSTRLDDKNETDPTFMMYWTHNTTGNQSTISFAVQVKALGWVGFGFANKIDEMVGYDVVMGFVDILAGTNPSIKDYHTIGQVPPIIDTQQDLMNTSVTEEEHYTTLKFTRLVDTKDENDITIKPGPMIVVWSYSNLDNVRTKHVERGYTTVTLIPRQAQQEPRSMTVVCQGCQWMLLASSAVLFVVSWISS